MKRGNGALGMIQGSGMVIWVSTSSAVVLGSFGVMLNSQEIRATGRLHLCSSVDRFLRGSAVSPPECTHIRYLV